MTGSCGIVNQLTIDTVTEAAKPAIDTVPSARIECNEESWTRSAHVDLLCVLVFAGFLALWGLEGGPPLSDHEAIVAQGARQIRQGDGWLIPRVGEHPFVRKPPLAFWLAALSSYLVEDPRLSPPVTEFAARLPSAVAAILTTFLVYLLGHAMFGHRVAVMSALVNASCAGTLYFSHNAQVEMVLTFFMTLAVTAFWFAAHGGRSGRLMWGLFYVSLALAMLAKAPQPLGAVALPLACWWLVVIPLWALRASGSTTEATPGLIRRFLIQVKAIRELRIVSGFVLFLLIFLPWPLFVYTRLHQVTDLWEVEFVDRYTGEMGREGIPYFYYIPVIAALVIPFSLSLPEAIAAPFVRVYRQHRGALLFILTWVVVQIVFFSCSAFKRPRYVLGALPGLALLLGIVVDHLFMSARSFSPRVLRAVVYAILLVAGIGFVIGGYYVNARYPDAYWLYLRGSVPCATGLFVASVLFLKAKRVLSFCSLLAATAAVFGWCWFGLGQGVTDQSLAREMAVALSKHSISRDDPITWVRGRPDAALMYYLERPIDPMFTDLELATMRGDRLELPPELVEKAVAKLLGRLSGEKKEYFILRGSDWEMLRSFFKPPGREVVRVTSAEKPGPDDWVVVTNEWNVP